ncbi:MAG: IS4 family transposase [Gammaproteobacteria bacterium]|nr:IS4 family transposase [Gammaproteobacteria bacterium]
MEERWFEEELSGCRLGDGRLDRRLRQLVERMEVGFGESIPLACQDWAGTKAAYRFFSNVRVSEGEILRGHFEATRRRFAASEGPVLVLHDTTEFTWKRTRSEAVGFTTKVDSQKDKRGRPRMHTVCGLLMHSSMATTTDGLPLGMAAAKFWSRKKFKGTNALKRKINPTRVPIEGKESMRWLDNLRQSTELLDDPARCVHICDREGDIWELFCLARQMDTHFLIRRFANRLAEDGSHTVASIMAEEKVRGLHRIAVRDDKGKLGSTQVELSYRRMTIRPPIAKQKRYPALVLTVLHAQEPKEPAGRPRIDWKLITDLPVDSHDAAVEKLQWYAMRWKIEVFHKILKSGCRAEQARLRTAERLVRLLAVFCILSWRVFWLTMLNRAKPDLEAALVLTGLETKILDQMIPDSTVDPSDAGTISLYLIKIARLGGYLARTKDPPPGNIVVWRGLSRLNDIALGATLQINDVGN